MTERPTVLVPRQVLEGESIPEGIPELLSGVHVLLLGYHVLPEQTATEQGREQFGEKATKRLAEFETMLEAKGATVETRLVFTHEAQQTINRVIVEEDCFAVLIPKATPPVERVLVAVRGTVGLDRLVAVLGGLFADSETDLSLYHVREGQETSEQTEAMFDEFESALVAAGITSEQLDTTVGTGTQLIELLAEAAEDHELVVMGETDPSIATYVFGLPQDQLAAQFLGPVLVVQRPPPEPYPETSLDE
ncbi:MAG: universal stress protein [Halodesulfurarchaeum sp.]|nr:universal stress protein [Halodesulfurarchaeum sp.]